MASTRPPPRPTILLTGFGPFPNVPDNLTARFVPQLAERAARRYRAHRIVSEILPTEWTTAPRRLSQLYAEHRPKLALHFGVSERATGFTIETTASNVCAASPDAARCLPPSSLVDEAGAPRMATSLPAEAIHQHLTARAIPVSLSDDAGQYLCNTIFYRALQHASAVPARVMSGFIHLPDRFAEPGQQIPGAQAFTLPVALSGAMHIIRVCLASSQTVR